MLMLMMKSYQKTCGAFLQWPCLGEPEVGDDDDAGDDGADDNDDVGDDGDDGDDDDDGGVGGDDDGGDPCLLTWGDPSRGLRSD